MLSGCENTHATAPFLAPDSGEFELFYSVRDARGRSHTVRDGLTLAEAGATVRGRPQVVLGPGALGAFDDSGAMGMCLVRHEGRQHLYYVGWSLGVTVPFVNFIGLAVSEDDGRSFDRVSAAPIVGRSEHDPFLAVSPYVLLDEGRWRMWYSSATRWEQTDAGAKHYYRIVYAESPDGVNWEPSGRVCIDFADDHEYAIARPVVVRDADGYQMWFSHRGAAYTIGHATSADGLEWTRSDVAGLQARGDGWESREVEYGFVFDHAGGRWLLYNGNDYGATGIGLASWEASR